MSFSGHLYITSYHSGAEQTCGSLGQSNCPPEEACLTGIILPTFTPTSTTPTDRKSYGSPRQGVFGMVKLVEIGFEVSRRDGTPTGSPFWSLNLPCCTVRVEKDPRTGHSMGLDIDECTIKIGRQPKDLEEGGGNPKTWKKGEATQRPGRRGRQPKDLEEGGGNPKTWKKGNTHTINQHPLVGGLRPMCRSTP